MIVARHASLAMFHFASLGGVALSFGELGSHFTLLISPSSN